MSSPDNNPEGMKAPLTSGQLTEISEADVGLLVNGKAEIQELIQSATLPLLENEEGKESVAEAKTVESDGSDPSEDMTWVGLLWFYLVAIASGALGVAEYLGEKLADLFGITSSRYPYIMEEIERQKIRKQKAEAEAEEEAVRNEAAITEQMSAMEEGSASEADMSGGTKHSSVQLGSQLHLSPVIPSMSNTLGRSDDCLGKDSTDLTMDEVDLDVGQPI